LLRRIFAWLGVLLGVVVVAAVLVVAGFRIAAAQRETKLRHDEAPSMGRFVKAADVELFVQEEGPSHGPPVVFIHGTGAWSEIWRGTMHASDGGAWSAANTRSTARATRWKQWPRSRS